MQTAKKNVVRLVRDTYFRLYGPLQAYFAKTRPLPSVSWACRRSVQALSNSGLQSRCCNFGPNKNDTLSLAKLVPSQIGGLSLGADYRKARLVTCRCKLLSISNYLSCGHPKLTFLILRRETFYLAHIEHVVRHPC
jgi:hypothetical protein